WLTAKGTARGPGRTPYSPQRSLPDKLSLGEAVVNGKGHRTWPGLTYLLSKGNFPMTPSPAVTLHEPETTIAEPAERRGQMAPGWRADPAHTESGARAQAHIILSFDVEEHYRI